MSTSLCKCRLQEQSAQERPRSSFIDRVMDALSLSEHTAINMHQDDNSAHNDATSNHASSSDSGFEWSCSDTDYSSDFESGSGGSDSGDGGGDGGGD